MIDVLHVGAFVRFEAMIAAVIEGAAPLGRVVPVVASVLGAEMRDATESTHGAGAVPVVIVVDGVAMVSAFERPPGAS